MLNFDNKMMAIGILDYEVFLRWGVLEYKSYLQQRKESLDINRSNFEKFYVVHGGMLKEEG